MVGFHTTAPRVFLAATLKLAALRATTAQYSMIPYLPMHALIIWQLAKINTTLALVQAEAHLSSVTQTGGSGETRSNTESDNMHLRLLLMLGWQVVVVQAVEPVEWVLAHGVPSKASQCQHTSITVTLSIARATA